MAMKAFFKDGEFFMENSGPHANLEIRLSECSKYHSELKNCYCFWQKSPKNIGKSENLKVWFALGTMALWVLQLCGMESGKQNN